MSEAAVEPVVEVEHMKKPPIPPKNCATCGWPNEGQVDSAGKPHCWFCQRYPLPKLSSKLLSTHSFRVVDDEAALVTVCGDGPPEEFVVSIYKDRPVQCPVCSKYFVLCISSHLEEVPSPS